MRGLMQHDELVLTRILERAGTFHPRQQIVTKTATGIERESYEDMAERAARLAGALAGLGVRPGDRVGSFGFNTSRHLELYFGVPCMGAVLHTLNIRLHPDQVAWIANHAEDKVILFNLSGHGHFDMQAYDDYLHGRLPEVEFEEAALQDGFAHLPPVPIPG